MRRGVSAIRLAALAACAALAGCAGSQDTEVAKAATALLDAVGSGDGAAACAALAPAVRTELADSSGKACEEAVLEERLGDASGPVDVAVFDTTAQAVVGAETVFLSRYDGQWLVIAAACTPVPGRPYDCNIGMP